LFLTLSSLLAEATSNLTYRDQAAQSFAFMRNVLFNTTTNIPVDFVDLNGSSDDTCHTDIAGDSAGAGAWIEGLSVFSILEGTTKPDEQLISNSYIGAMTTEMWYSAAEILRIQNGSSGDYRAEVNLPRGMATLYQRTQNTKFKADLEKYLAVQYNAILDQSTKNGTDIYSLDWDGPAATSFDIEGQTTALSVLLAAMTMPDTASSASPASAPNAQPGSSHKPSVGGIVGGVFGGALFLLVPLYLLWRRRARKDQHKLPPANLFEHGPTRELHIVPSISQYLPGGGGQGHFSDETGQRKGYSKQARNSLRQVLTSLPLVSSSTEPTRPRGPGVSMLGNAEVAPSSALPTTHFPEIERHNERQLQLLQDMGEALNAINRRLEQVEGGNMGDSQSDEPPDYPGSVPS
ncbi:hypothetical protein V5O48_011569, partial [Marasmius crinis-equi]